jgi:epoxyqueuosine reductase QueG
MVDEAKEERNNYVQLKKFALREGGSLFGVADFSGFSEQHCSLSPKTIEGLHRAVSVAFHLSGRILDDVSDGPTRLYFFHYQRANVLLDELGLKITDFLQSGGWDALPIPASQIIDWEKQRAHVSHKHAALKAGLGWIGRNNLLVTPQFGSRQRLITVLTNMPLAADEPLPCGCGTCRACISSCPSGSIQERPEDFDHVGCYQMMKVLVKKAGISQNICGLCVKACRGKTGTRPEFRGPQ